MHTLCPVQVVATLSVPYILHVASIVNTPSAHNTRTPPVAPAVPAPLPRYYVPPRARLFSTVVFNTTIDSAYLDVAFKAWGPNTLAYAEQGTHRLPRPTPHRSDVALRSHYSLGHVRPFFGCIDDLEPF